MENRKFVRDDERWAAVVGRDTAADGRFFYAVATTGIYCRPTCPSRRPRRDHVTFHATRQAAERAGFRPCRRCRPGEPALESRRAALVARACRLIESSGAVPSLDALARAAGMSRYHFHRVFRGVTGLTPRSYAVAHRARRTRDELSKGGTVTEAIYGSGFGSSGRFYASAPEVLGMTPGRFKAGAPGISMKVALPACSLGRALVAATDLGVCAVFFGDDADALKKDLRRRFPRADIVEGDRRFERLVADVVRLVERPGGHVDLPLDVRGTAFQQRVWTALRSIPAGTTATYAEIASRIGAGRGSARAVARACASNPVAVAIPCHRVVGSGGALTGYRWGVERKQALLDREARRAGGRR